MQANEIERGERGIDAAPEILRRVSHRKGDRAAAGALHQDLRLAGVGQQRFHADIRDMPFAQAPFPPFVAKPGAMADPDHFIARPGQRPGGVAADKARCPEYCRLLHCRLPPGPVERSVSSNRGEIASKIAGGSYLPFTRNRK